MLSYLWEDDPEALDKRKTTGQLCPARLSTAALCPYAEGCRHGEERDMGAARRLQPSPGLWDMGGTMDNWLGLRSRLRTALSRELGLDSTSEGGKGAISLNLWWVWEVTVQC